jgi:hypothetical protein
VQAAPVERRRADVEALGQYVPAGTAKLEEKQSLLMQVCGSTWPPRMISPALKAPCALALAKTCARSTRRSCETALTRRMRHSWNIG